MLCLPIESYSEHLFVFTVDMWMTQFISKSDHAEGKDWNNFNVTLVRSHLQFKIR
jgi:hypothetical protein